MALVSLQQIRILQVKDSGCEGSVYGCVCPVLGLRGWGYSLQSGPASSLLLSLVSSAVFLTLSFSCALFALCRPGCDQHGGDPPSRRAEPYNGGSQRGVCCTATLRSPSARPVRPDR
eukprot:2138116-Rhodomonas_salina.1